MGPYSAFLALPREIRDLVYEMVCEDFEVQVEQPDWSLRNSGILATSRQLRAESIATYYRMSTFYFANDDSCFHWLRSLSPKHRDKVVAIKLDTLKIYMRPCDPLDSCLYWWFSNRVAGLAIDGFRLRLLGAGIVLRRGILYSNDLSLDGEIQWISEPLTSSEYAGRTQRIAKGIREAHEA